MFKFFSFFIKTKKVHKNSFLRFCAFRSKIEKWLIFGVFSGYFPVPSAVVYIILFFGFIRKIIYNPQKIVLHTNNFMVFFSILSSYELRILHKFDPQISTCCSNCRRSRMGFFPLPSTLFSKKTARFCKSSEIVIEKPKNLCYNIGKVARKSG